MTPGTAGKSRRGRPRRIRDALRALLPSLILACSSAGSGSRPAAGSGSAPAPDREAADADAERAGTCRQEGTVAVLVDNRSSFEVEVGFAGYSTRRALLPFSRTTVHVPRHVLQRSAIRIAIVRGGLNVGGAARIPTETVTCNDATLLIGSRPRYSIFYGDRLPEPRRREPEPPGAAPSDTAAADWRDGAVCYEVFVRSFQDSDGDGIGDLPGLISRLDYLNDGNAATDGDLGVRCVWLMPVMAASSYHGYDVTDFRRVDPVYGTNEDFRRLVREAHARGIRVIVDMLVNHVSSEHPWFRHAALRRDSPWWDWFVWSDAPGPPDEWGGRGWHRAPAGDGFYYGFFSPTMPDLDWESPDVRAEMRSVAEFWLADMGADGLRLDAVRHLAEDPATGRAANLPRTHDFLRDYGGYLRRAVPGSFTIGEVYDSTGALLAYYPDQLDAYFAFEVADAILAAVTEGDGRAVLDAVLRLQAAVPARRYAPFLRNHDQPRVLTALRGDRDRARLAASLLLSLPGLPFLYYGEEIGMTGDKPDPRIRTPMHWARGPAAGFTPGLPWEPLGIDSLTANVEAQTSDVRSLLSHYRTWIRLRAEHPALGAGLLHPLEADREGVLAFLRVHDDQEALVVVNLRSETVDGAALTSAPGALLPGARRARPLAGGAEEARLQVDGEGRLRRAVPVPHLAPLSAYVFSLEAE